jgi:hypothetical protein
MTITTRFSIIKKDLLKAKDFEKNKKGFFFFGTQSYFFFHSTSKKIAIQMKFGLCKKKILLLQKINDMIIANPIYDTVFKRLLEDKGSSKFTVSTRRIWTVF